MAYSEYFNYSNCSHTGAYSNYVNYCAQYTTYCTQYANYTDIYKVIHGTYLGDYTNSANEQCSKYTNTTWYVDSYGGSHDVPAGQYSGGGKSPIYFNYTGGTGYSYFRLSGADTRYAAYYYQAIMYANTPTVCQVSSYTNVTGYVNWNTNCYTYYNYSNHANYANPNPNGPLTLSYSSPWSGGMLNVSYVTDSINAIKNLRTNILTLNNTKQNNATIDLFAEADLSGAKVTADTQYKKFKTTLDNLWNNLNAVSTGSGLPDRVIGNQLNRVDIENIKSTLDALAQGNQAARYTNARSSYNYANLNYYQYS